MSLFNVVGFTLRFCVLSIPPEPPWTIYNDLHPNAPLHETVCKTFELGLQTQGQGQPARSWYLPFNFVSTPYLLNHLNDFHLTSPKYSCQWDGVLNTWPSYAVLRSRWQFKVMGFTLEVRGCYISPEPFDKNSINFTQMSLSVRRCAEAMTQLLRLNVKVIFQGPRGEFLLYNLVSNPYLLSS